MKQQLLPCFVDLVGNVAYWVSDEPARPAYPPAAATPLFGQEGCYITPRLNEGGGGDA